MTWSGLWLRPVQILASSLNVLNNDDEKTTNFNGESIAAYDWRVYTAGAAPKK